MLTIKENQELKNKLVALVEVEPNHVHFYFSRFLKLLDDFTTKEDVPNKSTNELKMDTEGIWPNEFGLDGWDFGLSGQDKKE